MIQTAKLDVLPDIGEAYATQAGHHRGDCYFEVNDGTDDCGMACPPAMQTAGQTGLERKQGLNKQVAAR